MSDAREVARVFVYYKERATGWLSSLIVLSPLPIGWLPTWLVAKSWFYEDRLRGKTYAQWSAMLSAAEGKK